MRRLFKEESGISTIEFALVATVFFLFIFGIFDFGRAMWQWNAAAKATHRGARHAIVSNMVAPGLFAIDGVTASGGNGLPVPISAVSPNPVICDANGCNGYGPKDDTAFNAIVSRMQVIFDRIQPQNVVIEYRHVGLGFSGNPYGPDIIPTVTVKLQGIVFNLVTPGLSALLSINMPDFATTLLGEDLVN